MPAESVALEPRRFTNRLLGWICVLTTIVVVHTCLRIEWLNYRAGGFLPRAQEPDDLTGELGNPKWRVASERSIRANFQRRVSGKEYEDILAAHGRVTPDEENAIERNPRPLTTVEENELEHELNHNRANSRLRDWVQTGGLAQYLLAPLAVIMSLVLLACTTGRRARLRYGLLAVLSGGAVGMMLYRGYFASLGW